MLNWRIFRGRASAWPCRATISWELRKLAVARPWLSLFQYESHESCITSYLQYIWLNKLFQVLEILYCKQWTRLDGLGALIITPTRELAYQIYETLRKVGQHHDISAGLIIGGKDLKFEKKRMDQCNVVICTPGRLLHHMDENPLFDCVNMQVIVK